MLARLLKQTNLMARLRGAWRHDADEALKPVRKELRCLAHEVEALQTALQGSVVPFRPNTMLVFLNSRGAHGATIPGDAPREMERYAYQFYVAAEKCGTRCAHS